MPRQIKSGADVRERIKQGIDIVADTVKVTLGVGGRNVILDTNPYTSPVNTNDGVTIARELVLEDRFQNIGAKLIREVAARTNDVAGDGTTTSCVLMQAIVNEGNKAVIGGADPILVRRGIVATAKTVVDQVKSDSMVADDLETLTATATISCGDPELGAMVAEVIQKAGTDGVVTLEDNPEPETISERMEGLKLRGGFTVQNYINAPELQQAVLKDALIFVTNQNVVLGSEMGAIMTAANNKGKKNVVVMANGIESDALITSLKNWLENKFFALPIRVLAYGDMGEGMLRDVASITGAKFFDGMAGDKISEVKPEDLGSLDKVVATKHETTIITSDFGKRDERIAELKGQITATDRAFEKESLTERIAKLNNALFTIKVGGVTDTERLERKLRIEDAINATKAALTDGVVSGGGAALYRASMIVSATGEGDELLGATAVLKACREPIEQMALNSSIRLDRSDLLAIETRGETIDFKTGAVVTAFKSGIIDPTKVVVSALENAASGAALFLVTEAAVVLKEAQEDETL